MRSRRPLFGGRGPKIHTKVFPGGRDDSVCGRDGPRRHVPVLLWYCSPSEFRNETGLFEKVQRPKGKIRNTLLSESNLRTTRFTPGYWSCPVMVPRKTFTSERSGWSSDGVNLDVKLFLRFTKDTRTFKFSVVECRSRDPGRVLDVRH